MGLDERIHGGETNKDTATDGTVCPSQSSLFQETSLSDHYHPLSTTNTRMLKCTEYIPRSNYSSFATLL